MPADFPQNLPKAPTPGEMSRWDEETINFGIPENMLMEAAGCRLFEFLLDRFADIGSKNVCIFMGTGNNGGDGACLARHLHDAGASVHVFHFKPLTYIKGSCAWHTDLALRAGVPFTEISTPFSCAFFLENFLNSTGHAPDIIVDALLGTGFSGTLRPDMRALVESVNELRKTVAAYTLSVDIPSGMNGATGLPSPIAVIADATVTLAAPKSGMLMPEAIRACGEILVRNIGIPKTIYDKCPASARLLDGHALAAPKAMPANSYKNIFGHVYVLGGRQGYTGAAHLACAAALRAGAGLVTACAPEDSLREIKASWPEIMTLSLADGNKWPEKIPDEIKPVLSHASALVLGPGMGRNTDSRAFLEAFLNMEDRPATVLDADALILLSQNRDLLSCLNHKDILTPHPGEAAALLGATSTEVQKDRPGALSRLCSMAPSVFVLKGAGTLIRQGDGDLLISPYDIPQLAIGGAGDVLSGIIGALVGKKETSLEAAGRGVAMHAMAGLVCAEKFPERGALASDLANSLTEVPFFLERNKLAKMKGTLPWPR